uniref:TetR/AcrR family transcriptional regulator n=1 Tax=Mycobacteroides chelonae TaxID=1774 RepID=UPI003F585188
MSHSAPLPGSVPVDAHERLIRALAQSIEVKGYRKTAVTDVVSLAKASRRTFYRVFGTKDDALLALMKDVNASLIADLRAAVDPRLSWKSQVDKAIRVYFTHVERWPAVHLCSIRELPYLGEIAEPVIRQSNDAFASLITTMTDNEQFRRAGIEPATRLHAMMVQGALNELVADILQSSGRIADGLDLAIASTAALLSLDVDTPQPT